MYLTLVRMPPESSHFMAKMKPNTSFLVTNSVRTSHISLFSPTPGVSTRVMPLWNIISHVTIININITEAMLIGSQYQCQHQQQYHYQRLSNIIINISTISTHISVTTPASTSKQYHYRHQYQYQCQVGFESLCYIPSLKASDVHKSKR